MNNQIKSVIKQLAAFGTYNIHFISPELEID